MVEHRESGPLVGLPVHFVKATDEGGVPMAGGGSELLERMRRTRSGWSEVDLDKLYRSFGFREITRPRAPHRVYVHPEHPDLRATVARKKSLPKGYVTTAVRLIDRLLEREKGVADEENRGLL